MLSAYKADFQPLFIRCVGLYFYGGKGLFTGCAILQYQDGGGMGQTAEVENVFPAVMDLHPAVHRRRQPPEKEVGIGKVCDFHFPPVFAAAWAHPFSRHFAAVEPEA